MCDLCDVDYVGYTARHLFQRVAEHKNSAIGKHFHEAHGRRDRLNESKLCMDKKMEQFGWERFTISDDPSDNVRRLSDTLFLMFNECFPIIKDPEIRLICLLLLNICVKSGKRTHGVIDSPAKTMSCKSELNQIRAVTDRRSSYHTSSRRWWNTVNMITGRQARNAPVSSTIDPKTINLYFLSINTDDQYYSPDVLSISDGTRIPTIVVLTVWKFLSTLKRTAPGPDGLPFWIWRDYAYQLAPTITKVFTALLRKP